ncbi:hypothetical protein VBD025_01275 [Virgibacillus flavescens]|uniref:hypothetical protein n=1 Tax=Virgibacillus flavescens TaxID=1611422 RepID=UPI003D33E114
MNVKLVGTLLLITVFLSACTNAEPTTSSELPKSWIVYQGNKYTYNTNYTTEEVKKFELTPTGEVTGEDDGTKRNLEIYKDISSKSILIKDEANSTRPWLRYSLKLD